MLFWHPRGNNLHNAHVVIIMLTLWPFYVFRDGLQKWPGFSNPTSRSMPSSALGARPGKLESGRT